MQTFVKHTGYKSHKGGKSAKGMKCIKAHLKYIEHRKNELGEREQREMFGKEGEKTAKEFYNQLKEQPEKGVIAHKLVISMDRKDYEEQKIDLRQLTRDTMNAYEAKVGQSLNWIACVHDKESNPHVHIVVAGRNELGKEVVIRPHNLNQMKRIADKERGLQHERNHERELERGLEKEFDFEKQIAHERQMDKEKDHHKPLNRDLERNIDRGGRSHEISR